MTTLAVPLWSERGLPEDWVAENKETAALYCNGSYVHYDPDAANPSYACVSAASPLRLRCDSAATPRRRGRALMGGRERD